MKILCLLAPGVVEPGLEVSAQVRHRLRQALDRGLRPLNLPRDVARQAVDVDDADADRVRQIAALHDIALGRAVGGLLYALAMEPVAPETSAHEADAAREVVAPPLSGLREGQAQCLLEAAPLLRQGRVIVAENGTGSGKSRIAAHAAAYMLALRDAGLTPDVLQLPRDSGLPAHMVEHHAKVLQAYTDRMEQQAAGAQGAGERPVILAAPTIAGISHLAREWVGVQGVVDPHSRVRHAILLGRGQFVAPSHVHTLLEDFPTASRVRAWMEAGMPPGQCDATRAIHALMPAVRGLLADLQAVALEEPDGFPVRECALDEEDDPDDQANYLEAKEGCASCDLIITTHATLCLDNLRLALASATSALPATSGLIVDEAHLLESVQASVDARSVSLLLLKRHLSQPWKGARAAAAKKALGKTSRLLQVLSAIPNETAVGHKGVTIPAWHEALPDIEELAAAIAKMRVSASESSAQDGALDRPQKIALGYLARSLRALKLIIGGAVVRLYQSPKKGMISLSVGPANVSRYLMARWAVTPCALLLSGTMLYRQASGATPQYFLREVAVPRAREAQTTASHPSWITTTPVLHLPAPETFHLLMPPAQDNVLQFLAWCSNCAFVIARAAALAKGGTLVTCTSYERIDGLCSALQRQSPQLRERLLAQQPTDSVQALAQRFKAMARAGERPIWLATGAANVGLDLADEGVAAADDMLLTDLVVPNLPYGVDKSATQLARVERMGFKLELVQVQRRFLQMIGRLVRRDGLRHRHLWILDGRLVNPASGNHTGDLRYVLNPYIHRQAIMPADVG